MPQIVLVKAAQVPLKGPIRWPGYTAEVDDETFEALSARGVLAVEVPATVVVEQPAVDVSATLEEETPSVDQVRRPKQAANLDAWETYARALGIDTKGMTKQEIIAATK